MKISVIVTTWGCEPWTAACRASVRTARERVESRGGRARTDVEVIEVCDGSGAWNARNAGLRRATGDWLAFAEQALAARKWAFASDWARFAVVAAEGGVYLDMDVELVGLRKPERRNEGTAEQNVRAAIRYLSRKGFSTAARPAAERPKGYFDGWREALRRYNGRRDRTETDRYYSDEYADKIRRRAANPDVFVPIEIRLSK